MAKKVKTWLTDDLEAAKGNDVEADQTVEFGLDGATYEVDLSTKNATKLRNDIEQWIAHARMTGGRRKRIINTPKVPTTATANGMDATQRKACREWLRNNTKEWKNIGERGRIPEAAMEAFNSRPVAAVEFSSAGA